jgi:hypothetical protein
MPADADAGPSSCVTGTTCPAKDTEWACAAPVDCAGSATGTTCCLTVGAVGPDAKCAAYESTTGRHTTHCVQASTCQGTVDAGKTTDTKYVVCSSQSDCPSGTTCTPVKALTIDIGLCLP